MHAHRPFLLRTVGRHIKASVKACISAAKVLNSFDNADGMSNDGALFNAFWRSHDVTFCALGVVYVWGIQQNDNDNANATSSQDDQEEVVELFDLSERCHSHLASHLERATAADSPSRWYSVILEELRSEAHLQSLSAGLSGGATCQVPHA